MEQWDAYDKNFNKIKNRILIRGERITEGFFHLVCEILVKHKDGTYLLMQRDFNKDHYGGMWEASAGGSALSGESPMECALRELKEETGITALELVEVGRVVNEHNHSLYVEYLCKTDCSKESVTLQSGETVDYQWVTGEELNNMGEKLATTRMWKFIKI